MKFEDLCDQVVGLVPVYSEAGNTSRIICRAAADGHIHPPLVRYASCFIAMQMGKYLLKDLQCEVGNLTHRNFLTARALVEENAEHYFDEAIFDIVDALGSLYGGNEVSMQQLSATFRRGDLIEILETMGI